MSVTITCCVLETGFECLLSKVFGLQILIYKNKSLYYSFVLLRTNKYNCIILVIVISIIYNEPWWAVVLQ